METSGTEPVLLAVEAGVATITLNRPERRNALSLASAERLHGLWETLDHHPGVRVIILTSADCGTFCAGMDLKEAAEVQAREGVDILSRMRDPFYERMRAVAKPIIAAMTGHFTAGGMVLALNADVRIGLHGTKGGITEARIGRGSPWAVPLAWMLPQPVLMEMILTGEMVDVERLHALGFVNHLEDTPDAVRARALSIAHRIRDNAPLSVLAGKQTVRTAISLGCDAGFEAAKNLYRPVYSSGDAQEGPRAFAEKRPPRWTGIPGPVTAG